jgi:hypothetical protein
MQPSMALQCRALPYAAGIASNTCGAYEAILLGSCLQCPSRGVSPLVDLAARASLAMQG